MIPNKLFHYSSQPIEQIKKDYHLGKVEEFHSKMKPRGFWVSVEDYEDDENWRTWCEQEEFYLEGLRYKYSVKMKQEAKLLYLQTAEQIIEFSLKYKRNDPEDFALFIRGDTRPPYIYLINWEDILEQYDGIIIAPYQRSCRLNNPTTSWYYGWDCSSGCIWNVEAIDSLDLESIREEVYTGGNTGIPGGGKCDGFTIRGVFPARVN